MNPAPPPAAGPDRGEGAAEEQPVEILAPPRFEPGQKVRSVREIRDDGTTWGHQRGDVLIGAGEIGYVRSIGEFLQRYFIYDVDFFERGRIIGMRGHEIEAVECEWSPE
jgi:nitrogen fixation protein NifZ